MYVKTGFPIKKNQQQLICHKTRPNCFSIIITYTLTKRPMEKLDEN